MASIADSDSTAVMSEGGAIEWDRVRGIRDTTRALLEAESPYIAIPAAAQVLQIGPRSLIVRVKWQWALRDPTREEVGGLVSTLCGQFAQLRAQRPTAGPFHGFIQIGSVVVLYTEVRFIPAPCQGAMCMPGETLSGQTRSYHVEEDSPILQHWLKNEVMRGAPSHQELVAWGLPDYGRVFRNA
ncbi:uncharacterized protein BO95DRAFT_432319 [Aspergillus brunneoviolaceus CBS 621.78]|uniref:Uncharacterized protein n=1 Tax=Aspergillus brunneoviolaceus CBS 621.78 TaxID=1450534 RepID=A0ACD1G808_9EURO|nr:hypothetical protein BO95DRAFT_432319 [Aspergillus brunneoviolaceus CBS 621.78]RAH45365.1 hypothetical protein BO95DRAFT_432319 [Aspergillus brunneoviolaceus CBS 621.78]